MTRTSGRCWYGGGSPRTPHCLRRPRACRAARRGAEGVRRLGRARGVRRRPAHDEADQPRAALAPLRAGRHRCHGQESRLEALDRRRHPYSMPDHVRRQPGLLRLRPDRRPRGAYHRTGRVVGLREHDVRRRRRRRQRRIADRGRASRRRRGGEGPGRRAERHRPEGRHDPDPGLGGLDDRVHDAARPPDHLRGRRARPGRLDVRRDHLRRREGEGARDRLRPRRVDRRRHGVHRAQVLDLRAGLPAGVPKVRVREEALQLRSTGAVGAEAGAVMASDKTSSRRNVLGRSAIFTHEVINDIHVKSELGRYRMRGFSVFKPIPHWHELMFMPGTLTQFVIEGYREKCETKTVLGARFAQKPIELDLSTKWYYQCIQSRYGFNPHHLMLADACEFFIGQGCKVGLGGHLMGQKVSEQVAEMRSLPPGIDQRSPARHPDWLGPDDLSLKVQEVREATDYQIPIQLKLGAARVYDDVRMAAKCGPHIATEETGIPLLAAIPEARRALENVGLEDEIDLVVAGGIRNGGDIAKCLALGAKAVAIGHSALMALNCNKEIPGVTDYEGTVGVPAGQCYHCHTGRCPVGITTQDPELRKRLVVDEAAERVYNFLHTLTLEVQMLARACGKTNVHSLEPEDLAALTTEAAAMARVPLAGTNYIPGVTEERALAEMKRMLEKHLEYPVDYLPEQPKVMTD